MNIKKVLCGLLTAAAVFSFTGCLEEDVSAGTNTQKNVSDTMEVTNKLTGNQKTPTDIDYSLERYNLIKRAYWVNGQRQKADAVPCSVERPIGYIVLFSDSGAILGTYTVDGKITSLNSYLSPDSEYYEYNYGGNREVFNDWLADVDGSYGTNVDGVFWFTTDGHYMEWSGKYLYSDIPFEVEEPVLVVKEA